MTICPYCKAPNPPAARECFYCRCALVRHPEKASGTAITAVILAAVGLLCTPLSLVGLFMGLIENSNINRGASPQEGKGLCQAAIGIGLIPVVFLMAYLLLVISGQMYRPHGG